MSFTPVNLLPPAPDPTDPQNFEALAAPWSLALNPWTVMLNALGAWLNGRATAAEQAAADADADAVAAMGYRNVANAAAAQTTIDKGVTTGDRAQTTIDKGVTTGDRAQTALDRIATGQDRAAVNTALAAIAGGPVASLNGRTGFVTLTYGDYAAANLGAIALAGGVINAALGTYFTETVNGARTFAFSNVPAGSYGCVIEINHVSGVITLPAGTVWVGTAPNFTAGKRHLLFLQRAQVGTAGWYATAQVGYPT